MKNQSHSTREKETKTEVKSKDQENNDYACAHKEADPNTEDNIEDENETIDFTRKPSDDDNNEASSMNINDTILVNDEMPIVPLSIMAQFLKNT